MTNSWYMAGTEGTGRYLVVARNSFGRVGFRVLWDGRVRVRVEPTPGEPTVKLAKVFTIDKGWKQPDHQHRFSIVCGGRMEAIVVIRNAIRALRRREPVERQPGKRLWAKNLVLG